MKFTDRSDKDSCRLACDDAVSIILDVSNDPSKRRELRTQRHSVITCETAGILSENLRSRKSDKVDTVAKVYTVVTVDNLVVLSSSPPSPPRTLELSAALASFKTVVALYCGVFPRLCIRLKYKFLTVGCVFCPVQMLCCPLNKL